MAVNYIKSPNRTGAPIVLIPRGNVLAQRLNGRAVRTFVKTVVKRKLAICPHVPEHIESRATRGAIDRL